MPIKRHTAIQPLSRDHHHGLLLCWKIREGFKRKVEPGRMISYAKWFWEQHLIPHFEAEEKWLFPLLESGNAWVEQALDEHRRIKKLFEEEPDAVRALSAIEQELEAHIRFEERVLFNAIQEKATAAQLEAVGRQLEEPSVCDVWPDEFWADPKP